MAMPQLTILIPTVDRPEEFPACILSALDSSPDASVVVSMNQSGHTTRAECGRIVSERLNTLYWETRLPIGDHWTSAVREGVQTEFFTIVPDDDRITDQAYYRDSLDVLSWQPRAAVLFADPRLADITHMPIFQRIREGYYLVSGEHFLSILRADVESVLDICPVQYTTILRTQAVLAEGGYENCHSPDLLVVLRLCFGHDVIVCTSDPGEYKWNARGLSLAPRLSMLQEERVCIDRVLLPYLQRANVIELRTRLAIRTDRAILVGGIRHLMSASFTPILQAVTWLGARRTFRLTLSFLRRVLSGSWPRLGAT